MYNIYIHIHLCNETAWWSPNGLNIICVVLHPKAGTMPFLLPRGCGYK